MTPRTVPIAFRRHLGTTPMAYLRRVRLDRAHADLLAAVPGEGATVAGVAARWGYGQPGRFAGDYRAAYGRLPYRMARARLINTMVGHEAETGADLATARELVARLATHVTRLRVATAACAAPPVAHPAEPCALLDEHARVLRAVAGIVEALGSLATAGRRRRDDLEAEVVELRGSAHRLSACVTAA
ncbi:hypothetical protein CryarDRAFT_3929 [Cryptosporangium arvum DSM 44712]|uniref:HTH araC/xylS-type domain-containing protein n=1 Tax=Cryptosporangium arvum DSM 44712 TaxID=927661 RepID=A0A010Z5Y6_9ACTN|nr:hypothetical protein CryarDRAFT_3929 [Cryptosporangium arvum DSM 44712]